MSRAPGCLRLLLCLLVGLVSACGAPVYRMPGPMGSLGKPPPDVARALAAERKAHAQRLDVGERVALTALDLVGGKGLNVGGRTFRDDCSGLVEAVYSAVGIEVKGSVHNLWDLAQKSDTLHHDRRPHVGDVAFFDDTYDANGNREVDDELTHVAVVVAVDADGTISLVHRGGSGVTRISMNLLHPDVRDQGNTRLNDNIRVPRKKDPKGTRYLTGELWVGFASFWKIETGQV